MHNIQVVALVAKLAAVAVREWNCSCGNHNLLQRRAQLFRHLVCISHPIQALLSLAKRAQSLNAMIRFGFRDHLQILLIPLPFKGNRHSAQYEQSSEHIAKDGRVLWRVESTSGPGDVRLRVARKRVG